MLFRRLGLLGVALAMFAVAGGPCAVLQTVAWAEMLRDYRQQTGSVSVALEQTFDGQHPCALCLRVASAKSQEQKQAPAKSWKETDAKAKALPVGERMRLVSPGGSEDVQFTAWVFHWAGRTDAPPTPPPRAALLAA